MTEDTALPGSICQWWVGWQHTVLPETSTMQGEPHLELASQSPNTAGSCCQTTRQGFWWSLELLFCQPNRSVHRVSDPFIFNIRRDFCELKQVRFAGMYNALFLYCLYSWQLGLRGILQCSHPYFSVFLAVELWWLCQTMCSNRAVIFFFPSSHLCVRELHQPSSENTAADSASLRVGMLGTWRKRKD